MRRVGLVAIAALALAAITPATLARADDFESYNVQIVRDCVGGAGVDPAALRQCIGAGARPCIETDGFATSSYVLCWSNEADTWRELMDSHVASLNARHTYRDPQRLAAANAAWQTWADAECEYWAREEGGGSGEQVDRVRCLAGLTAERVISLRVALAVR